MWQCGRVVLTRKPGCIISCDPLQAQWQEKEWQHLNTARCRWCLFSCFITMTCHPNVVKSLHTHCSQQETGQGFPPGMVASNDATALEQGVTVLVKYTGTVKGTPTFESLVSTSAKPTTFGRLSHRVPENCAHDSETFPAFSWVTAITCPRHQTPLSWGPKSCSVTVVPSPHQVKQLLS